MSKKPKAIKAKTPKLKASKIKKEKKISVKEKKPKKSDFKDFLSKLEKKVDKREMSFEAPIF